MSPTETPAAVDAARVTGNEAWAIMSRIIAGMLLYGAVGWGLGNWLGSTTAGLAIGVIAGAALGLYLSITRIRQLGMQPQPTIAVAGSQSWSARMTRARVERASEVADGD